MKQILLVSASSGSEAMGTKTDRARSLLKTCAAEHVKIDQVPKATRDFEDQVVLAKSH